MLRIRSVVVMVSTRLFSEIPLHTSPTIAHRRRHEGARRQREDPQGNQESPGHAIFESPTETLPIDDEDQQGAEEKAQYRPATESDSSSGVFLAEIDTSAEPAEGKLVVKKGDKVYLGLATFSGFLFRIRHGMNCQNC